MIIRVSGNESKFIPVQKLANGNIKISFDKQPVYSRDPETKEITGIAFYSWAETTLTYVPSEEYVKNLILNYLNNQIDNKILSGFKWNDMLIWLSKENQFNYKAAYDIADRQGGANLPQVFKFGTNNEPVYYEFKTVEDLADFYFKSVEHIQNTLAEGWKQKDSINWEDYKIQ